MFTIGISPIILAFMFSAYSMFHENERFSSFRNTYLDLTVLIAGDEYQDNYKDTAEFSLSGVYFTLYGLVMLIVTANLFTFLVVAGYEQEVRDAAKRQLLREEKIKAECKNKNMRFAVLDGLKQKMIENGLFQALGEFSKRDRTKANERQAVLNSQVEEIKTQMKQTICSSSEEGTHLIMEKIESVNQLLNEIEKTILDVQMERLSLRVKNMLYNCSKDYVRFVMNRLLDLKAQALNYVQNSLDDSLLKSDAKEDY